MVGPAKALAGLSRELENIPTIITLAAWEQDKFSL